MSDEDKYHGKNKSGVLWEALTDKMSQPASLFPSGLKLKGQVQFYIKIFLTYALY